MKLLTQEIKDALPKYGATEQVPLDDKLVICKFFHPATSATWLVVEGEPTEDGDYEFFGWACLTGRSIDSDWGPFMLSELQNGPKVFGLCVERDIHFPIAKKKVSEVTAQYCS